MHDLQKAKALFSGLLGGVEPVLDQASTSSSTTTAPRSSSTHTGKGLTGPVGYRQVPNVKQTIADVAKADRKDRPTLTSAAGWSGPSKTPTGRHRVDPDAVITRTGVGAYAPISTCTSASGGLLRLAGSPSPTVVCPAPGVRGGCQDTGRVDRRR